MNIVTYYYLKFYREKLVICWEKIVNFRTKITNFGPKMVNLTKYQKNLHVQKKSILEILVIIIIIDLSFIGQAISNFFLIL